MHSRHQQLNPIGSYSSSSSSSSSVKKSLFCRARFSTRSNNNDDIDNNNIIINNNLRLRRQFFNSFRGYASSSNSTSKSSSNNSSSEKKNDSSGALTIEEDEEFDEITDKWIPEKPVTKAETAGYSVVIVLGLGLAASPCVASQRSTRGRSDASGRTRSRCTRSSSSPSYHKGKSEVGAISSEPSVSLDMSDAWPRESSQ